MFGEDVESGAERAEGDSLDRRSRGQELAQPAPSRPDQKETSSSFLSSILKSTQPKSHDPVKPALTSVQSTFTTFSMPTKDTDARDVKSQAPKATASERKQDKPKPILKPQPSPAFHRRAHPDRPDLVVLGGDDASDSSDQRKSQTPAGANKAQKPKMPEAPLQCGSNAVVKNNSAPPHSSNAALKKGAAPLCGSDTAAKKDPVTSRESDAAAKDKAPPMSVSKASEKKDAAPPQGSDAAVWKPPVTSRGSDVKESMPPCVSDSAVKKDVVPQCGFNVAAKKDLVASHESDAALKDNVTPPSGSETTVEQDAAPLCGSNQSVKKDVTISRESDAAAKDIEVPPCGSDTTVEKDVASQSGSNQSVKKDSAISPECDTAAKKVSASSCQSNAAAKKDSATSHPPVKKDKDLAISTESDAATVKDSATSRESDEAAKDNVAPPCGSDTAIKKDFWMHTSPPPPCLLTLRLPSPAAPSADSGQPTKMLMSTPRGEETAAKDDSEKVQSSMTEETTAAPTKAKDGTLPASACGGNEVPAVNNNNSTAVHNKEKEAPPVKEETLVKSDDALVSLCLRVYFTSHSVDLFTMKTIL
uniref:Uncharacterized protein n=1 Tax=Hippocampus comes TaxID=109280 RepID=A0A3Q2ZG78_HIPCM